MHGSSAQARPHPRDSACTLSGRANRADPGSRSSDYAKTSGNTVVDLNNDQHTMLFTFDDREKLHMIVVPCKTRLAVRQRVAKGCDAVERASCGLVLGLLFADGDPLRAMKSPHSRTRALIAVTRCD